MEVYWLIIWFLTIFSSRFIGILLHSVYGKCLYTISLARFSLFYIIIQKQLKSIERSKYGRLVSYCFYEHLLQITERFGGYKLTRTMRHCLVWDHNTYMSKLVRRDFGLFFSKSTIFHYFLRPKWTIYKYKFESDKI